MPLQDEDVAELTPTAKADPYKLLQKLKETQHDSMVSPTFLNSTCDQSPIQNFSNKRYSMDSFSEAKEVVLPKIKTRLSSNETVPYSEYIVGSQS